ncbi:myb family transcription factor PHL5-like [Mercurialis annua]|uniref:myb family transcription factor PHL5-like n=1 Tax=Mercurialis annua TaxID=3986 RepID=UPI00215DEDE7|nr:myb family transcription factor PHL5-like [Mercurialis annua]
MVPTDLDELASAVYAAECYLDFQQHYENIVDPKDIAIHAPPSQSSGDEIYERFQKNPYSFLSQTTGGTFVQLPEVSSFPIEDGCSSSASSRRGSGKKRMRWTEQLHGNFINCVNILGGAEKATPKAILKMMQSKGLTIFQIKSHLQKYRAERYMSEYKQGKRETRDCGIPDLYLKASMQIKEALVLQLEFEKRLFEQLKIQEDLQLKIEENGKQLKMMMQQQNKTN